MNKTWTDKEEQYLIANYATTNNKDLAKILGKNNIEKVTAKAFKLGLKKSKEFLSEQRKTTGQSGHFKKGMTPHNKGKKLSDATKAKLAKTMFKSGNRPHNAQTVGIEREDKDGYLMVKIAEPSVWQYKHHIAFGEPVPKGHKVIFIDGNKRNFGKDNLQLVSNAELMNRNTMHRYPPELVQLLKTLSKLKKRVSENA